MKNGIVFHKTRLHPFKNITVPGSKEPRQVPVFLKGSYEMTIPFLIKIPAPRFVVFYNGVEKQPESQTLKLSNLYQPWEEEPMLELQVLVLNINKGNNQWLKLKECV